MKNRYRIFWVFLFAFLSLALVHGQVYAQGPSEGDRVVFGDSYTLASGEKLAGDLLVFGGTVNVETNATVQGNVVLIGGSTEILGTIQQDITAIGGSLYLGDTAQVNGNVNTIGGAVRRSEKAVVKGETNFEIPGNLDLKGIAPLTRPNLPLANLRPILKPLGDIFWVLLRSLALAALAMLLMLFIEKPTQNVAGYIIAQPLIAGGLGLLTVVVAPAILIVLAITILLIPISLIGILVLFCAWIYGWIALGYESGRRIAATFQLSWTAPVAAGVGTLAISLVAFGIGLIPCIGWMFPFLLGLLGLGGVLVSKFGTQSAPGPARIHSGPTNEAYPQMAYPSLPDEVQKTSTRGSSKKPASFTDVIEDTGEIPEPLKPERRRKKPD